VPIAEGLIEPLFAIYHKSVIGVFQDAMAQGTRQIRAAFKGCNINYLDISKSAPLKNLNTQEEYTGYISELTEDQKD
jgi:molybdopterin-guanine dinucleotide biosynthesis protein A